MLSNIFTLIIPALIYYFLCRYTSPGSDVTLLDGRNLLTPSGCYQGEVGVSKLSLP